jgi:hypothetical protein
LKKGEKEREERSFEEKALLVPPRGTELSDLVEEFWDSQRKRIMFQLKIISRSKNELKRMIKSKKVLQVILDFEEALKKKESFENAYGEAMKKLESLKGKEEAKPYFILVKMVYQRKPFERIVEYIKPLLKEKGRWSDWTETLFYTHREQEKRIEKVIKEAVEPWPVWQNWLQFVRGIDLLLAAQLKGGLESALSPEETIGRHFIKPSQMRQFAGVGDPEKSKRKKGEPLHCNLKLKSLLLGRIASSFLRQVDKRSGESKSGYRNLYLKFKETIIEKCKAKGIKIVPASKLPERDGKKFEPEGVISEGHIHQQAMRKMMQIFVNHVWEVSRKAEGLPAGPEESYAFKVLGHPLSSYIRPIKDIEED